MRYSTPKLIDCKHDCAVDRPATELFLVEGDSAARTLTQIRDPEFQAILPMQGKPMNALKAGPKQLARNPQFAALLNALGIDLSNTDLESDIRYDKIILLFDPDADGIHSRTLMLLFFFRWMRWWLDAGRIFDTHAPQWQLQIPGQQQPLFASTPEHLSKIREQLRSRGIEGVQSQRFRGLGSIAGDILLRLCVDPETRKLDCLSADHARQAIAIFEQMRVPIDRELPEN